MLACDHYSHRPPHHYSHRPPPPPPTSVTCVRDGVASNWRRRRAARVGWAMEGHDATASTITSTDVSGATRNDGGTAMGIEVKGKGRCTSAACTTAFRVLPASRSAIAGASPTGVAIEAAAVADSAMECILSGRRTRSHPSHSAPHR